MKRISSRLISLLASLFVATALLLSSASARAQDVSPPPDRSSGWNTASKVMALSSAGLVMIMPRIFYSDPEVTAGWKARWHLSVLAPTMTLAAFTLLNEVSLKGSFKSFRPGCDETNVGVPGCESYGMFSSYSFLAFSSLGQGTGIFLVDTLKWSNGHLNGGALAGDVVAPLILSVLTAVGRSSGNWETGGQVWGSAGLGFGAGIGMGVLYALLQRPECGYSGGMICW
ncbi:MAG TPA: hypothetical protein VGC79_16920 [Polyangiaceae bacterium]